MRRALVSLGATAALIATSVAVAAPVHAADATATCTGANQATSVTASTGGSYSIAVGASCGSAQWAITTGSGVTATKNSSPFSSPSPTSVSPGDVLTFTNSGTPALINVVVETSLYSSSKTFNISFTAGGGGGGGNNNGGGSSSSSSSSAPAPVQETLSLALTSAGATCTGGNPTGYSGAWLTLPSADQCSQSGPNAKPGAKLLGWATSATFPVAVAQKQVDLKWGVIDDTFYGMRMIFIPAGMSTFVSGSNTLFPIWSA